MAGIFTKRHLSGSVSGRGILVTQAATPGDLVHTAVAGADDFDEIYLWAHNTDATARKLTTEWGGVTSPNDTIEQTVPAEAGLVLVAPGLPLNGGVIVRAFAAAANLVVVVGYVNRIDY